MSRLSGPVLVHSDLGCLASAARSPRVALERISILASTLRPTLRNHDSLLSKWNPTSVAEESYI